LTGLSSLFGHCDDPWRLTVFRHNGSTPDRDLASGIDFWNSLRWQKLSRQLVDEAYVTATRTDAEHGHHGFEFGTSLVPQAHSDEQLPAFALRFGTASHATLAMVEATLDDLMVRGRGVQALLARWGSGGNLQRTTYERICGIQGPHTLSRSWLTRYLRGVDHGPLWLGPDLTARLGDLDALRAVADVLPLGDGILKITAPPHPTGLDALEHALDALLPRATDC